MSQYLTNKIITVVPSGTALNKEVKSESIDVTNSQTAKIVITSSEGEVATTKAKVVAILADETEQTIKEIEISVGNNTETKIDVVANEIAHYEAKEVIVVVDAIADTSLTCGVIAVLGENRYTE